MDPEFDKTYNAEVSKIKLAVDNYDGVISYEAVRSILYLNQLTNHKSLIVIGDISYYESMRDYRKDKKKWGSWYKNNKCIITAQQSANVMDSVIRSTHWMDRKAIK